MKMKAWVVCIDGVRRCSHCEEVPVLMDLRGTRKHGIDPCIVSIVKALNEGDVSTAASCCGHGDGMGNIKLDDGRVLAIFSDWDAYKDVLLLAIEHGLVELRSY